MGNRFFKIHESFRLHFFDVRFRVSVQIDRQHAIIFEKVAETNLPNLAQQKCSQ